MIRILAALAAAAIGATAVHAQNTQAIALRQATMKQYGRAIVVLGKIAKGDIAFDLPTIQATLKTIEETSQKANTVFPDDSKIGETNTLPAAFKRKSDLFARFDALARDANAANSAIVDEASFKAEWAKIGTHCVGCHKDYKKPD
jgi:cytochrome c556